MSGKGKGAAFTDMGSRPISVMLRMQLLRNLVYPTIVLIVVEIIASDVRSTRVDALL
jgi:hypothetical protein